MSIKHKIIFSYIKDLSVETPDPESLIIARERISKYGLKLDITSRPLKNKMTLLKVSIKIWMKKNELKT